jgi:hypothetical protein
MLNDTPAHEFLLPRLTALVNEAVGSGIAREVAVAVLIDLVTSPGFDTAAPDPHAGAEPRTLWQRGPGQCCSGRWHSKSAEAHGRPG